MEIIQKIQKNTKKYKKYKKYKIASFTFEVPGPSWPSGPFSGRLWGLLLICLDCLGPRAPGSHKHIRKHKGQTQHKRYANNSWK